MNRSFAGLVALALASIATVASGCRASDAAHEEVGKTKQPLGFSQSGSFNGSDILGPLPPSDPDYPATSYIWFTMRCDPVANTFPNPPVNVSSCASNTLPDGGSGTQSISFIDQDGDLQNIVVPNGRIIYVVPDPGATIIPSTEFIGGEWVTIVPFGYTKSIFLTGVAWPVPKNLAGSINNVTWSGNLSFGGPSAANPIDLQCKWNAEVYGDTDSPKNGKPDGDGFTNDYSVLNVKPIDDDVISFDHTERAGSPHNYVPFRMQGGINETGNINYNLTAADYAGNKCSPVPTGPCIGKAEGAECEDGDKCVPSACHNQACVTDETKRKSCATANACHTVGTCIPSTGDCPADSQSPNGTTCDDQSACTTGDACLNGNCVGTPTGINVDDGNPCTIDSCDPVTGQATHVNATNGTACNDGNACTQNDTCQAGVCAGSTAVTCSASDQCHGVGTCDPGTGVCSNPPLADGTGCNDGNLCTTTDVCTSGQCVGSGNLNVDDGNVCTDDSCDPTNGAVHTNNTAPCNDGNACTTVDVCSAGQCVGSGNLNVDDGNVCTDDSCDPTAGAVHTNNTAPCNDGNACTTTDVCSAGQCVGSGNLNVDDGNVCTDDSCNPATGAVHTNNTAPCNDGNACTTTDVCSAGQCVGSGNLNVDDGNVCTDDSCNPATGAVHTNNTAPCNDGNACTTTDVCSAGQCVGSGNLNVDDGNVCTDDSCDPTNGAVHTNNTAPCNDGNACTTTDVCSAGQCVGSGNLNVDDGNVCTDDSCDPTNGAVHTNNTAPCNDGNACTTTDVCSAGQCVGSGNLNVDDGNVCTDDSCDPTNGAVHTNNTAPCNDGNACTTTDVCSAGQCVGSGNLNVDDGNVCTDDSCDPTNGAVHTNNTAPCNDGNACTTTDVCSAGQCVGSGNLNVDDGNVCTDDSCDPTNGAVHTNNTAPCNDGNACTTTDVCSAGQCVGSGNLNVDDGNVCTDDSCDPTNGAVHTNNTAPCNDGNACTTTDVCSAGQCVGSGNLNVDDGNVCTDDSCDPTNGAVHTNNTAPCNDGNACTTTDVCSAGQCVGSGNLNVDDGNVCTDDSCDPTNGAVHTNNTAPCNDGNACTTTDVCSAGQCVGSGNLNVDDGNVCTDDSCDPTNGAVHTNNTAPCNDGNACTTTDVCSAGQCVGSGNLNVDDGNVCTDDSCDPTNGAVHTNNTAPCNDGNACTTTDVCSAGQCVGSGNLNVDDGNVCTDDSCDPTNGAVHTNNTAPCNDGNACTTTDVCSAGQCVGSGNLNVDDGNVCTDDSCDPTNGAVHTNNTAPCNDGNACTTTDVCSAGQCVGSGNLNVDDGNVCTDDSCDPTNGAVHTNNTAPCNDGNACTTTDVCSAGQCVGSGNLNVDDGNVCTDDSCDPTNGAVHTNNTAPCNDGNACTTTDVCSAGQCVGSGNLNVDDGNVCTDDSCDPTNGAVHTNNTAPCNDGNACTTTDVCSAGQCVGSGNLNVDDGNVCTDDSCDPTNGAVHTNNTAPCNDGNACTTTDVCSAGQCVGSGNLNVDDGNVCTDDSCDPTNGAVHTNNTAPCNDGNACTTTDVCSAGQCVGSGNLNVDDGNVCTDDSCDPTNGAVHTNNTAPCNDGNACTTTDVCSAGQCVGSGNLNVDDGNVCTDDSCDPTNGAVHTNNTAPCNDGNACTTTDVCSAGQCVGSGNLNVDDGNVCTTDSCDPTTGAVHTNNTAPCNDGNACTTTDVCSAGQCVGSGNLNVDDGNVCTTDSCDPATGAVHANNTAPCDDGNACTTGDTCGNGTCGGTPVTCQASDQCHVAGQCNPQSGTCSNPIANPGTSCNDGTQCTSGDACNSQGDCVGNPVNVDDGNPCTADSCSAQNGVTHTPTPGASCSDGNACNGAETCNANGACQPGIPVNVDDNNVCTTDSCDPATGAIAHVPVSNGTTCGDGDACNGVETCQQGACTPGAPLPNGTPCDDSDLCTQTDSCQAGACVGSNPVICTQSDQCHDVGVCRPGLGTCSNPVRINGAPCEDGDLCTDGDSCQGGTCRGGAPKTCTASDQCHVAGVCNPATGCSNPNAPNGTPCNDTNACTTPDVCTNGSCGGNAVVCAVPTSPVCDPTNGSCGACTGHNGSNTPRACPTVPEPACLGTGECVECTITGGNPNGNTVRCTGNTPICNDVTKKCVECTDDAQCPNGFCDLTTNKCVVGCNDDADCPNGKVCENNTCVSVDAGVTDAGTDSGVTDAGTDAGGDAGDDGGLDAGDAGTDAGDGGKPDGGDGGPTTDGGNGDGGNTDGGKPIDEDEPFVDEYGIFGTGCDCNQAINAAPESSNLGRAAVLFGIALAFVARRRRSSRSGQSERRD